MRLTIKIFKQFELSLILFSKHYCEHTSGHMWVTWIRAVVHQIKVVVIDLPKDSIALILNCPKVMFTKWIVSIREVTKTFHQVLDAIHSFRTQKIYASCDDEFAIGESGAGLVV